MKNFILISLLLLSISLNSQTLKLYGGRNHNIFLGCLNCNDYSHISIWNEYSDFGNSFSQTSLWNEFGDYGSEFSDLSPWNEFAAYPPVIVDDEGNFYGYLTVNKMNDKRADFKTALIMYKYYDLIRDNVTVWYKKIFEDN